VLKIPYSYLYPAIICLVCIGVYSIRSTTFDVALVLVFGIAGYLLRLLRFEPAPLLIGLVLGPMVEENLRRAMQLYRGDLTEILTRPISGTVLALTLLVLLWTAWTMIRDRRERLASQEPLAGS
jgi:TctA family transporter